MVVVADGELHRLPGWIAIYRAALAQARGDVVAAEASARRALELVLDGDHLGRGAAAGFLGLAAWTSGDLEAADRSNVDCLANVQRAGYLSDALGCAVTLADLRVAQGRLSDALRTCTTALDLVSTPVALRCEGRQTSTSPWPRSAGSATICRLPWSICWGARSWASTRGCRTTGIAGLRLWRESAQPKGICTVR
jgi:ATP/maltotriose-dependent transcriptional regulator MalT